MLVATIVTDSRRIMSPTSRDTRSIARPFLNSDNQDLSLGSKSSLYPFRQQVSVPMAHSAHSALRTEASFSQYSISTDIEVLEQRLAVSLLSPVPTFKPFVNLHAIENWKFSRQSLFDSLCIPESIELLGHNSFADCSKLSKASGTTVLKTIRNCWSSPVNRALS
jgi:hypothetical protein